MIAEAQKRGHKCAYIDLEGSFDPSWAKKTAKLSLSDIDIADPLNGRIILTLSSANTANISAGRYVYDVVIKDTNTNGVTRVLEGIVNVLPRVTVF